ncbi:MAG: HEAT repeat domain-containing protein [Microthrixaceae bacterium]
MLLWDGSGTPPVAGDDPHPVLRAARLSALSRHGRLDEATLLDAVSDPSQRVRLRALALAGEHPELLAPGLIAGVLEALAGDDQLVAEAAAAALGEAPHDAATSDVVAALAAAATEHNERLVREAAVAALGSLGHQDGLAAVLSANSDVATVRRRAVLALAAFDGPAVEERLNAALTDRDWQVRQGAEDLLDSAPSPTPNPTRPDEPVN